ncbi:MAG TPA: helix-turn-helix transcriptional regulator [Casimicrobiaceae bacterium]|nr:helix-turn-helix transcriptional regulator [Myxococcota bacterium]HTS23014.1 helix-turn-helix transcriptional regulator [Casimicrobiaceae bacterium]
MPLDRDEFLIGLYRLFAATARADFCDAALEHLKGHVPFDSAIWGTFARGAAGPILHQGRLHRVDPQMLEEYEPIKHHDTLNRDVVAKPGRTVNISLTRTGKRVHPAMLAHARRWGMEHTLATTVHESALELFTLLSLYRENRDQPFSESQRRFVQAAMPHLVAAWHMNALHFLDSTAAPAGAHLRARALIDGHGVVHNAEAELPALLRSEFPCWRGPSVPSEVLALTTGGAATWTGKAIVASLMRALDDRTFLICVRPRAAVDALAPRELEVGREFSAGKSHKAIAALLGTSPATVRSQLRMVYTKLGVATKIELLKQLESAD